jgi:isoleucyl-tRNA synthetase
LETFTDLGTPTDSLLAKWQRINEVRSAVNKQIENKRQAGLIGSSLQANVEITGSKEDIKLLNELGHDLKFVFIVSRCKVVNSREEIDNQDYEMSWSLEDDLHIKVTPSNDTKCERCWHYSDDVGHNPAHPTLCGRCDSNLHGDGEVRHFA